MLLGAADLSGNDLVRAWKDQEHRDDAVDHPAGDIMLDGHHGGGHLDYLVTTGCTLDEEQCGGPVATAPPHCAPSLVLCL